ncbi:MAG: alpha-2-macroglobulin [Maricaulaceae bacterium]
MKNVVVKNLELGILFIAISIFVAGFIGYAFYPNSVTVSLSQNIENVSIRVVEPDPTRNPNSVGEVRLDQTLEETTTSYPDNTDTHVEAKLPQLKPLQYRRRYNDENSVVPTSCFSFSQNLTAEKQPQYTDYIDVTPRVDVAVSVKNRDLCLSGFEYGQDYKLTLKTGLPADGALPLSRNVDVDLSFAARPPYVGFSGNGIILPRKDAQGIGFDTVNVSKLKVTLYRVNDRMIARRAPTDGKITEEGGYSWQHSDAASTIRTEVWTGDVDVKSVPNETVTTVFPLSDVVGELKEGAYVISVVRDHEATERRPAQAWRWVIVTDIAMTTYRGDHGMSVFARSLKTAKRLDGVKVQLLAANNEILASKETDALGRASFEAPLLAGSGALQPHMVLAYGTDNDFAMIDLRRPPLDMSDYDIGGRSKLSPIDGYGFAERGIYRPGEMAHLTFMLRTGKLKSVSDRGGVLKIIRPDNVVVLERRIKASEFKGGTLNIPYTLSRDVPRGRWQASLTPDGQDAAVSLSFDVQDFVSQKLRVKLDEYDGIYDGGSELRLGLQADFLYGAPASDLPSDGEARVEIDLKPFPEFKDYAFSPRNPDFTGGFHYLTAGGTDEKGHVNLVLESLPNLANTALPLRLQVTGGVSEPSGRYVRDSVFIPTRTQDSYAGIRSPYATHRAPRGKPVDLDIVLLDKAGAQKAGTLSWVLMNQDWDYQWYKLHGRWRYRRDIFEHEFASGTFDMSAGVPTTWSRRLQWGDYRLVLKDGERELTSYEFAVGWGRKSQSDKPDDLQISLSKTDLEHGDRFTLMVTSPYAGEADLILTNNDVFVSKSISLSEGVSEIDLTYDQSWGQGVYALVSVYTPRDVTTRPIPRRAVGTQYIRRNPKPTTLNIDIKTPDVIRPNSRHEVLLNISQNGGQPDGPAWANLTAVDEGILQLTKYQSPAADTVFHAKAALAQSIHDDYGRILNPNLGSSAIVRSGGDGIGGEGLTVIPQKTVSLFEGMIEVRNGKAVVPLDIPDFNGELRLMTTAWSNQAVGSASRPVTVRDPVPYSVALPRFLAPGDEVEAVISVDNVSGVEGAYAVNLDIDDYLSVKGQAETFELETGQRQDQAVLLKALDAGVSSLKYAVFGPQSYARTGETQMQVRSPYLPISYAEEWLIKADQNFIVPKELLENFFPRSVDMTLSVSVGNLIDPTPYAERLRRYPYGCTEQTTSAALALLYGRDFGVKIHPRLGHFETKMQQAINRLVMRQSEDGTFGLWREGDGNASLWLGVYTSDFLLRANENGYDVEVSVLERTRKALESISKITPARALGYRLNVNRYRSTSNAIQRQVAAAAYASYVMARDGKGRLGQARYLFDAHKKIIKSPLTFGYLSETFALLGDDARAQAAFDMAKETIGYEDDENYYQTSLRDVAGLIAVLSNKDQQLILRTGFVEALKEPNRLRTQEIAHVLLALRQQSSQETEINITSSGVEFSGVDPEASLPVSRAFAYAADINKGLSIRNNGEHSVLLKAVINGSPRKAPEPVDNGLIASKTLHNLKGETVELDQIRRGERYVVKLGFASKQNRSRTIVVADLLPAGFEIEQILLPSDGKSKRGVDGPFGWAGEISKFDMTESRDDRLIISGDTYRQTEYTAAYIVRATMNGDFALPGVVIEDMYRPGDMTITKGSRLRISNGGAL